MSAELLSPAPAEHVLARNRLGVLVRTSEAGSIDRERPVVFYCRSGSRSALATQAFAASGYSAHNLTGGLPGPAPDDRDEAARPLTVTAFEALVALDRGLRTISSSDS